MTAHIGRSSGLDLYCADIHCWLFFYWPVCFEVPMRGEACFTAHFFFAEAQRCHLHYKVGRMEWSWNRQMRLEFETREIVQPNRARSEGDPRWASGKEMLVHIAPVAGVDLGEVSVCFEVVGEYALEIASYKKLWATQCWGTASKYSIHNKVDLDDTAKIEEHCRELLQISRSLWRD